MAKPTPAWVERAKTLVTHEAIFVTQANSRGALWVHLKKLDGKWKTKTVEGGFVVTRL